jgi:hypothetical protein
MDVKSSHTTSFAFCFMEWKQWNPLVGVASQVKSTALLLFLVFFNECRKILILVGK